MRRATILLAALMAALAQADAYNYCAANSWKEPAIKQEPPPANTKLQFVQVITRHGDRTSLTQLPTDYSEWNCSFDVYMLPSTVITPTAEVPRLYRKNYLKGREVIHGNCAQGYLTQVGYQQHLDLGNHYRQRYIHDLAFLSPNVLSASELWVRSTDITRTLQSAQGNLLGLYPLNSTTSAKAVPVVDQFTIDSSMENMYPNDHICPRITSLSKEIYSQAAYLKFVQAQQPFLNELAGILNLTAITEYDDVMDALLVLTCSNKPLPKGVTPAMVSQMFTIANEQYNFQLNNTEFVTLGIGSFLQEIVDRLEEKVAGKNPLKYMYYSGHDTTIAPLAKALGVYDGLWPPYASHIEIELWAAPSTSYVSVFYQGQQMTMPGCGSVYCPIKTFLENTAKFLPTDFDVQCEAKKGIVRRPVRAR